VKLFGIFRSSVAAWVGGTTPSTKIERNNIDKAHDKTPRVKNFMSGRLGGQRWEIQQYNSSKGKIRGHFMKEHCRVAPQRQDQSRQEQVGSGQTDADFSTRV
jgi:hypothetical protein